MTAEIALAVLIIVILLVWLALAKANRIDLLHQKVTRTGATLDAQLLRRAGLAAELASSGELDPASSIMVAQIADACLAEAREIDLEAESDPRLLPGRATLTPEREALESELSQALRLALENDQDVDEGLVGDVLAASRRVSLARRFYNEATMQVRRIRLQPMSRLLRLAGGAGMPRTFEMDDLVEDPRSPRR